MRYTKRIVAIFAVFTIFSVSAFGQNKPWKTEFKLGTGFGASVNLGMNNFFSADTKWFDVSGGASVFFDATYAVLDVDFWWGTHNSFGFDSIKYGQSGITYNLFAQYPFDYVGGRSFLLLGLGYRQILSVTHKSGDDLQDRVQLAKDHELDSLWLKVGAGDHKSLTDLLYLRYQILLGFRVWGEKAQVSFIPEAKAALGFWIK